MRFCLHGQRNTASFSGEEGVAKKASEKDNGGTSSTSRTPEIIAIFTEKVVSRSR